MRKMADDLDISTHSLTRRLTRRICNLFRDFQYFNSQPHKEADLLKTHCKSAIFYFNSQPHKEADRKTEAQFCMFTIFQLTASQGG